MNMEDANSPQRSSSAEENMEFEQEASSIQWRYLPGPALETIYSYLNREDQGSMSQVCKNWSMEYSSPSLWRKITFQLPEQELTTDMHPAVRSAQKFGKYFHHVQVVCGDIPDDMLEVIKSQVNLFLHFLTNNTQLLSISFIRTVENEIEYLIPQSVIDFLVTQNRLQSVEFQHSQFEKRVAMDIIEIIFSRNSRTLKNLSLKGFIDESSDESSGHTTINGPLTLKIFMNLNTLTIDYNYYFEDIIRSIYEHGTEIGLRETGKLEKMVLFCDNHDDIFYDGIQPEAWAFFRKIFPNLILEVSVYVGDPEEFELYIVPHMPVSSLTFEWYTMHSELGVMLRHLMECEINNYLEILNIKVGTAENIAPDLLLFLLVSPKLRELQLHFHTPPVNDFESVFEYWLGNGPMSLEIVYITLTGVGDNALISYYTNLANNYAPLLQILGLILILVVKS